MSKVHLVSYRTNSALIEQLMQNESTMLIDTRYSPSVKMPEWGVDALKTKYGEWYQMAGKQLGNFRLSPGRAIKLVHPEKGIGRLLRKLRKGYDLVLLCGCSEQCPHQEIEALLKRRMSDCYVQSGMI